MEEIKKYFEVTVTYDGVRDKFVYVDALNEDAAINVVKNFKTIFHIATSSITNVKEIGFEEYITKRAEIASIKKDYKNFELVLSVPNDKSTSFSIKNFYVRAENEKAAREYTKKIFKVKGVFCDNFILSVNELEYSEFKKRREMNLANFYKVVAKCGHVGDRKFYPVNFYVFAKSKNEAAKTVKGFPRVKKGKTISPIISVEEISKDEYEAGRKEMNNNLFLHHDKLNSTEQQELYNLVEQNTQMEDYKIKYKKYVSRRSDDILEEELNIKKYKQTKKKYHEDAGLHLNKSLKYGKILDVENGL